MEEISGFQSKSGKKYNSIFIVILIVVLAFFAWKGFNLLMRGRAFNQCREQASIFATMPGNINNQEKAFDYLYVSCMKIKGYTVDPIFK